jgi:hypothetical protein
MPQSKTWVYMSHKTDYSGMTVNERLFESAQVAIFDLAARSRNRRKMIDILESVDVRDAEACADAILKNPEKYGYL